MFSRCFELVKNTIKNLIKNLQNLLTKIDSYVNIKKDQINTRKYILKVAKELVRNFKT